MHCMCIAVNTNKAVIKFLQGSAVTQTVLGGIIINHLVANFLECMSANNYDN